MNILVLGGGGREHAIIKALKNSKKVEHISCAPGNPGIAKEASCHLTDPTDMRKVLDLAQRLKPDLVVVGPEAPLASGVVDALRRFEFKVFGPNQKAAQLESSKVFSKEFMVKYQIPTARHVVCASSEEMVAAQTQFSPPWILKADGLAAGKGVRICDSDAEFKKTVEDFFEKKVLGKATEKVVIEECLAGEEISVLALVADGKYQILPVAQDYKRLNDGQKGPNTGGMGSYAPVKSWEKILEKIENKIIAPSVKGLEAERLEYRGVLYFGVMIKEGEPYLLEYNARFGDPEAQVILPLLQGDWADVFYQVASGKMPKLNWNGKSAVCVVLAAPGYPEDPKRGLRVIVEKDILKKITAENYILHAGTASHNGYITSGGRVLNLISIEKNVSAARKKAYDLLPGVIMEGMQFRTDIAAEVEKRKEKTSVKKVQSKKKTSSKSKTSSKKTKKKKR